MGVTRLSPSAGLFPRSQRLWQRQMCVTTYPDLLEPKTLSGGVKHAFPHEGQSRRQ